MMAYDGLSPGWLQAIIWTNAGILLTGPFRANLSEILIRFQIFSFKKMHLKMLSAKWCLFCFCLNVLKCLKITLLKLYLPEPLCSFIVMPFGISEMSHHLFQWWSVAYLVPWHYLIQFLSILSDLLLIEGNRTNFSEISIKTYFLSRKSV